MISLMLPGAVAPLLFCLLGGLFGSMVGSFLGVVIERVPRRVQEGEECGVNLLFPPSHCASCLQRLRWWQNIPLISWLALRGRCAHCQAPIPFRLVMIEWLSLLWFAATAWYFPGPQQVVGLWLLWTGLAPLVAIDLRHLLLPDCLTQPLLWCGLFYNAWSDIVPLKQALAGASMGYLFLCLPYWGWRLLCGKEGIGYGDVKLLAALGAWLGWRILPQVTLLAGLLGIAAFALLCLCGRSQRLIPFGPCLSLSGVVFYIAHIHASII